MRFTRSVVAAAGAGVLVVGCLTQSVGSAAAAPDTRYADYLTGSSTAANTTGAARLGTSGADECSKPLTQRVGAWACAAATGSAPPPVTSASSAASTGFCNVSGCFLRYDDFHLDWQSGGFVYGYGTQTVGQGDAYINWQLTGPNNRSNPARFRVTTATVTAHMSGVLSNGAPGVTNGGRVLQGPSIQGFGAAPAGTWRAWPNGGFGARDTTSWDHNVTIEFSWTMSNYPGYWYVWVRSSVSHTTDKQIYRFDQPSQVPGNDYGSGHNS